MQRFVSSIVIVITALLVTTGTGCRGKTESFHVTLSDDQLEALTRLVPGQATRTDVVAILGEPYQAPPVDWDSVRELFQDLTGEVFSEEELDSIVITSPSKMLYFDPYGGKTAQSLVVLLDGENYVGYWRGDFATGSAADLLDTGARLAGSDITADELRSGLGVPPVIMRVPAGARWQYFFDAPVALDPLGVDKLSLVWLVDTRGQSTFWAAIPFADRARSSGRSRGGSTPKGALTECEALLRDLRAEVAEQMARARRGPPLQTAHAMEILSRLLPVARPGCTRNKPVIVRVIQEDTLNAYAHSEPGREVISITTCMLDELRGDDELAFVVAHELAHIAAGHVHVPWTIGRKVLDHFRSLQALQHMEYEADVAACELVANAGYDPAAADRVLKVLSKYEVPVIDEHPPSELRRAMLSWYTEFRGFPVSSRVDSGRAIDGGQIQTHGTRVPPASEPSNGGALTPEDERSSATTVIVSCDDARFPKMAEAVDGIAIKIKDTDPDPDADVEVYRDGERILRLKDWPAGGRAFVEGRSGKRYELRLLDINDETETIRVDIAECE